MLIDSENEQTRPENTQWKAAKEMVINNIEPSFPTTEARENKHKEIAQILYNIFSKYP